MSTPLGERFLSTASQQLVKHASSKASQQLVKHVSNCSILEHRGLRITTRLAERERTTTLVAAFFVFFVIPRPSGSSQKEEKGGERVSLGNNAIKHW